MEDGVIYVMITFMAQLKLMSFVISWDTLVLQATLVLDSQCKLIIIIII